MRGIVQKSVRLGALPPQLHSNEDIVFADDKKEELPEVRSRYTLHFVVTYRKHIALRSEQIISQCGNLLRSLLSWQRPTVVCDVGTTSRIIVALPSLQQCFDSFHALVSQTSGFTCKHYIIRFSDIGGGIRVKISIRPSILYLPQESGALEELQMKASTVMVPQSDAAAQSSEKLQPDPPQARQPSVRGLDIIGRRGPPPIIAINTSQSIKPETEVTEPQPSEPTETEIRAGQIDKISMRKAFNRLEEDTSKPSKRRPGRTRKRKGRRNRKVDRTRKGEKRKKPKDREARRRLKEKRRRERNNRRKGKKDKGKTKKDGKERKNRKRSGKKSRRKDGKRKKGGDSKNDALRPVLIGLPTQASLPGQAVDVLSDADRGQQELGGDTLRDGVTSLRPSTTKTNATQVGPHHPWLFPTYMDCLDTHGGTVMIFRLYI